MIKKLRIKFILTNMILITMVMLIAYGILYFTSARDLEENSISAMRDIASNNRGDIEYLFEPNEKRESKYSYLSTYVIELDERTDTCYIDGFGDVEQLTDEKIQYINALINSVNKQKTKEGVLQDYNMRFYSTDTPVGMRIVLLDKRYEDDNLNQLLISFFISGAIAFAAFLAISIVVSGIAIKPVEHSMKQQKQLISDVSHELKTPITIIATNTDIVLSHKEASVEDEQKWLGYIKDETNRMSELVNMMLYLAKTDETDEKPQLTENDLSSIAYEVALPFESLCFEKRKTFDINIEPNVFVKCEESSVKQLIIILLDNAVKYSNECGRIELSVRINTDKAILSVFNTGEPIPKESIPHLFDRFYRIDKARSRESGGSGLGLSIAKRIIENNEASISVTSNQINGTVFTCMFDIPKNKRNEKDNTNFT